MQLPDLSHLSRAEKERAVLLLREKRRREERRVFFRLFPHLDGIQPFDNEVFGFEAGQTIYSRDKYPKHMELFTAGATYRERCFMAANRVGKTLTGAFEVTAHLTGRYPDWWPGKRFNRPVSIWAAGKTYESTRDIVQNALLGPVVHQGARKTVDGVGMIPSELIASAPSWRQGVQDLVDTVSIQHVSGKASQLTFKSYQQGRGAFEGTAQDVVWVDEEPPADIYDEAFTRTMTKSGLMLMTFTPLEGRSDTVMKFMPTND